MTDIRVKTDAQALTPEQQACLQQSSKIQSWKSRADAAFDVKNLQVERAYFFGTRLGYALTHLDGTIDGRPLHGLCFLRGNAVGVLIVLTDR